MTGTGAPVVEGLSELRRIGSGGFSTVYSAVEDAFRRPVAVKILSGLDDDARRRFQRELALMGQLHGHPNVVTPHRHGYTADGAGFVVMELAARGSLQDIVADRGPLPWSEAVGLILPIADALGHAHERGIVHLDVKPANILLTESGVPKLTDFGISSIKEATATVQQAFTLAHAPPETFGGGADQRDSRSDLYALASTLFALVAGRSPFEVSGPDSVYAHMQRVLTQPAPSLGMGPAVDAFMATALAKDPAHRPQTAADLSAALRSTVSPSSPESTSTNRSRGPGVVVAPKTWTDVSDRTGTGGFGVTDHDSTGLGNGNGNGNGNETVPRDDGPPPHRPDPAVTDEGPPPTGDAIRLVAGVVVAFVVLATVGVLGIRLLTGDDVAGPEPTVLGGDPVETGATVGGDSIATGPPGSPAGGPTGAADPVTSGVTGSTTSPSAASAPEDRSATLDPEVRAQLDQEVAERIVIQTGDLNQSWQSFDAGSIESLQDTYRATPGCARFADLIGEDGVTASAGGDVAFVSGNQALSVIVEFHTDEGVALQRGPALLLDLDYQGCLRTLQEASVATSNPAGSGFETSSREEPVTPYGQRAEGLRTTTVFDLPGLDDPRSTTVRYRIQIGRAVLSMLWVGESGNEPAQLQILQTVASRFEQELAAYDG